MLFVVGAQGNNMTAFEIMLFVEFCIMISTVLANKVSFGTAIVKAAADYLFYLTLVKVYAWSKLSQWISLIGFAFGLV